MTLELLLSDALRLPLERRVSAHLGRAWQVQRVDDLRDLASHPAAVLADESYAVFVKLGEGELVLDQFTQELAGLRYLTQHAGVLTPPGIDLLEVESYVLLVLEAVQVVEKSPESWRQMGQALARIHRIKGERWGFETHNYWGSLYQDNTPLDSWVDFFRERRLTPRLKAAVDSGNLPLEIVPAVERLSGRLADLCGPPVAPSLLHGDAHHNNFISTSQGPVLIDPAIYYGHPELELAYVDFFSPAPQAFYQGYREMMPVDPGFTERFHLWRIPAWLAMVEVDGPQHVDALNKALNNYV
jgi:protein-ribulosamine 3-kinase